MENRMGLGDLEVLRLGIEWGGVGSTAGNWGLVKPGCPLDKGGAYFPYCKVCC